MSDRRRRKKQGTGRDREDASVREDGTDAVADGRPRKGVAPLSENARSRVSAARRFDSAEAYASHAIAVAEDIFNGEPLDAFNSAGKYDDRTLRLKDHELRVEQFRAEIEGRTKRLSG